ncbi:hypothetical protein BDV29DRAFT_186757 [Aspergillus leporis]|uniref:Uncharacterized protein n=1 Tax=Aspergillus leporis TaxID=41062 RepID=A0A5N5WFU8_9EURO|nr:hypothetical protein BDV29DRAFT_186757 [Aspergillus leporis]
MQVTKTLVLTISVSPTTSVQSWAIILALWPVHLNMRRLLEAKSIWKGGWRQENRAVHS